MLTYTLTSERHFREVSPWLWRKRDSIGGCHVKGCLPPRCGRPTYRPAAWHSNDPFATSGSLVDDHQSLPIPRDARQACATLYTLPKFAALVDQRGVDVIPGPAPIGRQKASPGCVDAANSGPEPLYTERDGAQQEACHRHYRGPILSPHPANYNGSELPQSHGNNNPAVQ
ncbi:hypothetical protein B0T20DRAFT_396576 [Sordaria brevicollis]|uniref:Uncharacterized protein n=1 Tax=Sordaria brevicollis TaxID=83679 RepID=A0AAE0P242_SORBR|nr:hypothetical protein B0T20DRAFT_396576 [Sordaria brevicollis]